MPEPMPEPTPDAVPGPGRLPGPVVAGVDGSRAGGAAAEWAAHEASARRLPLLLLHAWSWEPVDMPVTQDEETHRRLAEDMLRSTERGLRERHPGLEITAERVHFDRAATDRFPVAVDAALRKTGWQPGRWDIRQ
ncbi:universal stress protein, partial [Streptomyces sp. NPDC048845]|uniref:universal stress protein n=1 Tax=Streptomyces sp. NPDC048845 TaxID=3155390 RepID=UPI00343C9CD5